MTSLSRIGLGTAQFGSRYGISNHHGRPSEAEIADILACAVEAGIGYLDTAPGYGDAEILIGRHLAPGHALRVITKISPIEGTTIEHRHRQHVLDVIACSLERLKLDQLYGVLLHRPTDLTRAGSEHVLDALMEARDRGWVTRIGASVYDTEQLTLIAGRFRPDLVQLPLNALDRRLMQSGWLARLTASGTEIHARSVFLQGLLLLESDDLPDFFAPIEGQLSDLRGRWNAMGVGPIAGCLAFVLQRHEIAAVILGVNRRAELEEIAAAVTQIADRMDDFGPSPLIDQIYLDPSRWPCIPQ
jgi:aryl-alcohol dehydrogenase-like predicted oxidoreductase